MRGKHKPSLGSLFLQTAGDRAPRPHARPLAACTSSYLLYMVHFSRAFPACRIFILFLFFVDLFFQLFQKKKKIFFKLWYVRRSVRAHQGHHTYS
jgi:hypothetical protein